MLFRLLLCLFCLSYGAIQAQNILPIGAWRTHLHKRVGNSVTQSKDQIYYATVETIMVFDKDEISPRFISKVDGLSNVGIRIVRYHDPTETLIIVYENGVIDLLRNDGEVLTVNAIRNFTNITGEKKINDVFLYDDQTVFLAGTFGVSAFRVDQGIFPFTTFMGDINVLSVAVYEGQLFAGTGEGIYFTPVNSANIEDFASWNFAGSEQGYPDDYSTAAMAVFDNRLFVGINEDVYTFAESDPVLLADYESAFQMRFMSAEGQHLIVGYRCSDRGVCGEGRSYFFRPDGSSDELPSSCTQNTNYAIEDEQGRIWYGDNFTDFRYLPSIDAETCSRFVFDSPRQEARVWDVEVTEDEIWLAHGAYNLLRGPIFVDAGIASFIDGDWTQFNRETNDAFKGRSLSERGDDLFDLIDVEKNTVTNKLFAASYTAGLLEIEDKDNIILHDRQNSPLRETDGDEGTVRISGLQADTEGNMWVSNFRPVSGEPLHRLAPDGTWESFDDLGGQRDLFQIAIDDNDFKWVIVASNNAGVLVFDEGDIDNPNDDRVKVFTANNSNLETNQTNCLVVDNDGDVWVGTDAGIIIFECGASAFDDNCIGSKRIVELDGFLEFLFKTQVIQALAVDGANRKWVGTARDGAYLISADGKETITHFTASNSPLLSNSVRGIDINQTTGEVFFATDQGLISYQSDAVVGTRNNKASIKVYPNPVRPDYEGPIAIQGVAENAIVKVTDVNGKLVNEFRAFGGQAIWDGRDYNGRKVQTGVYLVFASTNPREAGLASPDAAVTKILFIN